MARRAIRPVVVTPYGAGRMAQTTRHAAPPHRRGSQVSGPASGAAPAATLLTPLIRSRHGRNEMSEMSGVSSGLAQAGDERTVG